MSLKSSKKEKQFSFDSVKTNKYFRTVLVAYYMLTRNVEVLAASAKLKDETVLQELFYEYERYVAGFDIEISVEQKKAPVFKVPDFTSFKISSLLQILKKTPKF